MLDSEASAAGTKVHEQIVPANPDLHLLIEEMWKIPASSSYASGRIVLTHTCQARVLNFRQALKKCRSSPLAAQARLHGRDKTLMDAEMPADDAHPGVSEPLRTILMLEKLAELATVGPFTKSPKRSISTSAAWSCNAGNLWSQLGDCRWSQQLADVSASLAAPSLVPLPSYKQLS